MAETNPFDFASRAANSVGDTFGELKAQWDGFLEQPGARTALLQFGINMMQPAWDAGTMGQFGRAIGSAGEAVTAQQALEQRERESEARIDLAQSRAEKALMGRQVEGWKEEVARQRAENQRQGIESQRQRGELQALTSLRVGYARYLREVDERNSSVLRDPNKPPEKPMSWDEYRRTFGMGIGGDVDDRLPPSATPASPTLSGRGSTGAIEISTQAQYDALSPGQEYTWPGDGKVRKKPGQAQVGPKPPGRDRTQEDPMGAE